LKEEGLMTGGIKVGFGRGVVMIWVVSWDSRSTVSYGDDGDTGT
jgi:hypothetical protein